MTMTTGTLGDLPTDQQVLGADKVKDKKVVVSLRVGQKLPLHLVTRECWSNGLRLWIC